MQRERQKNKKEEEKKTNLNQICVSNMLINKPLQLGRESLAYHASIVETQHSHAATPFLFYKNTFYKNMQAEIPEKIRTLIRTCPASILGEKIFFHI